MFGSTTLLLDRLCHDFQLLLNLGLPSFGYSSTSARLCSFYISHTMLSKYYDAIEGYQIQWASSWWKNDCYKRLAFQKTRLMNYLYELIDLNQLEPFAMMRHGTKGVLCHVVMYFIRIEYVTGCEWKISAPCVVESTNNANLINLEMSTF